MKSTLAILIFLISLNAQSQVEKIGDDLFHHDAYSGSQQHNCGIDIKFNPEIHENLTTPLDGSTVEFIWPFDEELDDGLVLVNYIDHQSGSGIKDYNDNDWSYNGHRGTDISLHHFRAMDRFRKVLAAASGIVVDISFNNFDRNTAMSGDPANYVLIKHSDGTYAYYFHLMKKSVLVKLGEYVTQGQLIGYVGSSGSSTDAHLHFEPGSFVNGSWKHRDPWQGIFYHAPTLWADQYPYVGNRDFFLQDGGIYTDYQVGGNLDNFSAYRKEALLQPNTISGYTDSIGFYMLYQGNYTGQQIRLEMRRPNGSVFKETYIYNNWQSQYGYIFWTPAFNAGVDDNGDWYVRVLYNNVEKKRYFFNVQLLTSNRPKLYPAAGKCFRRSLFVQRDTLRVRPVRTNMEYELVGAPQNVTLTNDSILSIGSFTQTFRNYAFKVIASIGGSATLRDTMIYHLIDTTKNIPGGNGVCSMELRAKLEGFWDGNDMNPDTVTVILRAPLQPFGFVDSARVVLNGNGYALVNFFNANPDLYYWLIIKHRNSIETWGKTVVMFDDGYPIEYDFTTSQAKAYGNNLKFKGGEYCMYSGDVNQDGFVNLTDIVNVYNASAAFADGYKVSDLTGDNETTLSDVLVAYNNSINFVQRRRP